jgi:hypothetical protein
MNGSDKIAASLKQRREEMIGKYSAADIKIMVDNVDSYDPKDYVTITGFADDVFYQSPKLWHTAEQLESGNWKVSVEHKGNRVVDVELSDGNYKKYGIDKLQPTTENPFKINYDDADLIGGVK